VLHWCVSCCSVISDELVHACDDRAPNVCILSCTQRWWRKGRRRFPIVEASSKLNWPGPVLSPWKAGDPSHLFGSQMSCGGQVVTLLISSWQMFLCSDS
jgi:hypothetical protein